MPGPEVVLTTCPRDCYDSCGIAVTTQDGALLRVDFATLGVTGRVATWLSEREAEIDLWVQSTALGNLPWLRRAAAAAVDHVGKRHRVARFRTTVRAHQVPALNAVGFKDGEDPDPWLRKHLDRVAGRNL